MIIGKCRGTAKQITSNKKSREIPNKGVAGKRLMLMSECVGVGKGEGIGGVEPLATAVEKEGIVTVNEGFVFVSITHCYYYYYHYPHSNY